MGRIPSAVGYQPTLANEMAALQERITSTDRGSITSVQAIYVPADDLSDPAPATTFNHLDATTVLDRSIAALGIYPAVDPLESKSSLMDESIIGKRHFRVARSVRLPLLGPRPSPTSFLPSVLIGFFRSNKFCYNTDLFKILLPFLVWMNCLKKILLLSTVPEKSNVSCLNHFKSLNLSPERKVSSSSKPSSSLGLCTRTHFLFLGEFVELEETISGFRDIVAGKYDHLPEQAFYMVGNIDTVLKKGEEIAAEVAKAKAENPGAAATKKTEAKAATTTTGGDPQDALVGAPKPTETNDDIRKELLKLANECKERELKTAAEIKAADKGGDELQPGWRFPKENEILKAWQEWDALYAAQTDLVSTMQTHFASSTQKLAAERAKDLADFGASG